MKNQTSSLDNSHFPVMLNEVIKISAPINGGIFVDCTLGSGGYTSALLKFPNTKVIAIDRDKNAISIANKLREKFNNRFNFYQLKFSQIDDTLNSYVDTIIFDQSFLQFLRVKRGMSNLIEPHLNLFL